MSHIWIVAVVMVFVSLSPSLSAAGTDSYWVYIGTGAHKPGQGIYLCKMDLPEGKLTLVGLAAETKNPSFVALHPTGKFLYAVGEGGSGVIRAYSVDSASGNLTFLNEQSSGGAGPCHVAVDREGKNALSANYSGGSVGVLPIGADGTLSPPSCVIQHHGSSINPHRQDKPYAHSINLDPSGRFAVVCDLGCDKLFTYRYDASAGKLTANDPPSADIKPGSGPRHMVFSADAKFVYVINEMGNSITGFSYDADRGSMKEIQMIATLPGDFTAENTGAEILLHPSGKFLYASNRGQDSIAIFKVDSASGKLTADGYQSTQGKTPRFFGMDPTASVIIAANQNSESLLVLKVDPETGHLTPGEELTGIPSPTCAVFLKR